MPDSNKLVVEVDGKEHVVYEPQPYQLPFHASKTPNLLALGTRGTGKSTQLRFDAILRCLMVPNFHGLIVRRTMPELRKSHLRFIGYEMRMLGGVFLNTTFVAKFPNGSTITFAHCETDADVMNFLSSEYGFIGFDELSTFSLEQFLQICAAARAPEGCGYDAVVRASSNPLGLGAEWMQQWFITKDVSIEDYPDYNPDDFEMQFSTLEQNKYLDFTKYSARLKNLPDHVRRAWLKGEFVFEGMYFTDFRKFKDDEPWHVLPKPPTWKGQQLFELPWLGIYRAVDWGYFPDPAVCLWIAVLPNKRTIVFKERHWKRTLATDVARDIKRESEGMHIVDTYCDPTMEIKTGATYSIAELFEQAGVSVTPSTNDRVLYGYSIHDYLNTLIDGLPQLQIVDSGCPTLVKTIPIQRMDKTDARKLADGNDHWVVALAYFCMSGSMPSQDPITPIIPRWMIPKSKPRQYS